MTTKMTTFKSFDEFIEPLKAAGYDAQWYHTGGGCTAIAVEISDSRMVLITDCPTSLCGQETSITPPARRAERLAAKRAETGCAYAGITGDGHGFAVGWNAYDETDVYDGSAYVEAPDAVSADLPALVAVVIGMVERRMGGAL